jgi:nitroreductase
VLGGRRSRSIYADEPLDRRVFVGLIDPLVGEEAGSSFPSPNDLAVLLFVHRVEGLEPGLYLAADRWPEPDPATDPATELRRALRPGLEWQDVGVESRGWHLVRLSGGDARRALTHLSSGQSAAGDGAFTALFLGRFEALRRDGAWAYRRLHWQAGELGHRLYLGAEAEQLGATGLGGFYDARLCQLLGPAPTDEAQSVGWHPLYLLAVGHRGAEDPTLEPPYAHRGTGAEPAPASRGGMTVPA